MKIVIQCAASKDKCAGKLKTSSDEKVLFVADPDDPELRGPIPAGTGLRYARPDAKWREVLKRYNEQPDNPCKLYRAAELYTPNEPFRKLYRELADAFGWESVFILSAGWGLIRASFWTPDYNITFSKHCIKKKPWAWRNTKDRLRPWLDFNHLQDAPIGQDEPIHFFGGKDYLPTFYALVETVPGKKIVHYKGKIVHYKGDVEHRSSFDYEEYVGKEKDRTWHYRAAKEFVDGRASVENQVSQ